MPRTIHARLPIGGQPIDRHDLTDAFRATRLMPYWLDSPDAPAPTAPLQQDTHADLLVVGGGFTGLWAAIQAKEHDPNMDVLLIEAGRVAHGASGRAGGIISTSIMHGLPNAVRVFPQDIDQLEAFGRDNLDGFEATLARYGIDADIEWNGEMTVAVCDEHLAALRADVELHRRYGHQVEWLDRAQLAEQIRSPLFAGAMWSRERSGTVHPAKLAWGLRRAALQLGVRLHEMTPLTRLRDRGAEVEVQSPGGRIVAPRVLLGSGTAKVGVRDIQRRVAAIRDHVLATEPLSAEQMVRIGWAQRQGIYDTRTQLNYFRLTRDNRIIFGGSVSCHYDGDPNPPQDGRVETYHRLAQAFYRTFPQLAEVRFSHAWGGPIDYCSRGSVFAKPYLGGKAVFVAGYTGFGIGASRFGARMGLNMLLNHSGPESQLDIARLGPTWIPPEPLRWLGAQITFHAIDGADAEGGWKRAWVRTIKALGFPM